MGTEEWRTRDRHTADDLASERFTLGMSVYIDDLDDVPAAHRRDVPGKPQEFKNMWHLYVGKDSGLIHIQARPPSGRDTIQEGAAPEGPCSRIGAFHGYRGSEQHQKLRQRIEVEYEVYDVDEQLACSTREEDTQRVAQLDQAAEMMKVVATYTHI
ncbi:hypothetical protein M406DRAFT_69320 [Cryphonectria parasitica EP155]|uniref:Uncharacterized protein n=1 Tax=Cryphonectria parasitica (strain ATCC 38755 / EP155) TaxID=660469 RepID=A0A9P4Y5M8_CRYP1|nr:uncharacterized protein M406DRAFT_69320 [Cryphonectria parasitica EP155]KAF3767158.1 hypothetical protein M406DRAFT_69320 [Cryphonectria parasitica EP155]